ncbi:MAG: phosphatase PAP2 family protein [Clostridia bacterium]|nr:phosphatase PAP2 family protein [Clostridia bacterium]
MKQKQNILLPVFSALLFILLTILLLTVDVAPAGPENVEVGLSHFNGAAHRFFGSNTVWYFITETTGYTAIASGSVFVVAGLVQLIKRKSFLKVDKEIYAVGVLYVLLGIIYALSNKITINCRPIFAPGENVPEPSFPSSHTLLSLAVMGSAIMLLNKYIKNKTLKQILTSLCAAIATVTVIGRILSGVHWFTDILGSIFLTVFLLSIFRLFINTKE